MKISTKERGQIVDDNGYIYSKRRTNVSNIVWACRVDDCKGQGLTSLDYINNLESWALTTCHNHISNYDIIMRKILILKMKKYLKQLF